MAPAGVGQRRCRVLPPSCSGRGVVEDADEVAGLAAGGVGDLVAAARAVGGEKGSGRRRAYPGQHAELADLQRYVVMLGFIAERPSHATASRVEAVCAETGDQLQRLHRSTDGSESLLVAMPMQQRGSAFHWRQWQLKATRRRLAFNEFFEKLGALC